MSEELERCWAGGTPGSDDLQVDFDSNYQLMVEDALTISEYDVVYFIDATHSDIPSIRVSPVDPSDHFAFSTHSVDPGGIVALARELYGAAPRVFLVEVAVAAWEPAEPMTRTARANAAVAVAHLLRVLESTPSS